MEEQTKSKSNLEGVLYALAAFTAWGFLPLFWHSLKSVSAAEILAHRIVWSFVFVIILLVFRGELNNLRHALAQPKTLMIGIVSSVLVSANWFIYIWAVTHDHLVETSLGYYITPLFNVLLGVLVLKERLNAWQKLALSMALIGVSVITWQYGKVPWVALSLTLTFGLYGLVKKLTSLDALTGLAFETLLVMPIALGYLIMEEIQGRAAFLHSPATISAMLVVGGVVTALPLILFAQGAKLVSLSTLGFTQYLSPSINLLLGIFVFHEGFSRIDMISFGFIWCGLVLYSISNAKLPFKPLKPKLDSKI